MRFRVWMHSTPSPGLEFYKGKVDVFADDADEAKDRALHQLRRGAFPDRSASMWVVEKIETIG